MTVTTTTLYDGPDRTDFRDWDDVAQTTTLRTVWKTGSPAANNDMLLQRAVQARTYFRQQATLLSGGSFAALTVTQQTTLLANMCRALANLAQLTVQDLTDAGV